AAAVAMGRTPSVGGACAGAAGSAPAVPAPSDGRVFKTIATLRIPVRYPAVAALGGKIYVFGGDALTSTRGWAPVDAIQAIDPARHTAAVVGHLAKPLARAAAMTLHNQVFLARPQTPPTPAPP